MYVGRFAPSPTGPLHLGSLVAAVASYMDARAHGGRWLVRIEDVDGPRTVPGAADEILRALERFGFAWDGDVIYQSTRGDAYQAALDMLSRRDLVFGCGCTRREIESGPYPGTCRAGVAAGREARATRLRVPDEEIRFPDRWQGIQRERLTETCGDFVLKRADGCWAYQLAVVVDDAWQGVTDVVRGVDLLDSTARQIWLARCLGIAEPTYLHVPVVLAADGQKLSKQTGAAALSQNDPAPELRAAFEFLGFPLPTGARTVAEIWQASAGFDLERR